MRRRRRHNLPLGQILGPWHHPSAGTRRHAHEQPAHARRRGPEARRRPPPGQLRRRPAPFDHHEARVAADRATSATTRPASRPARPRSTSPCSSARFRPGAPSRPRAPSGTRTSLGAPGPRLPHRAACEGACVREAAEGKHVEIGRLQRHATDAGMAGNGHRTRGARETGRRVAGPARTVPVAGHAGSVAWRWRRPISTACLRRPPSRRPPRKAALWGRRRAQAPPKMFWSQMVRAASTGRRPESGG
jgi:hypothetical protein